jgi:fermentation-respiration switch protein FrsA (DUF1100 family)
VKKGLSILGHAAVLVLSARASHSASGFVVMGVGLALLLDRYVLRLLPWPPVAWGKELAVLSGAFLVGAAGFYFARPGIVPVWEAAFRGVAVCLLLFLMEVLTRAIAGGPAEQHQRLAVRLLLLGLFALLIPVAAGLHPLHTVAKRTPAAFGLAFEDVRIRTADGVELAAWLVPHADARGNVIFCHGHGRNRGHVAGLLPTLHDLGLNVLAFDFRGHGDSEGHTSTFGHREVADLIAVTAYLNQRFPDRPRLLVGISLGAAASLQALPELPQVKGVWSEGAFAKLRHAMKYQFAWLPAVLRRPLLTFYDGVGWLDCNFWGPSVNPIDAMRRAHDVPIYFCHGEKDELVPLVEGKALEGAYGGPKWHWWVQEATHYDVRQRNRDEYLARFRAFLAHCLRQPA